MRIEVARRPLGALGRCAEAAAYKGEKQMAQRALEYVAAHPENFVAR